MVKVTKIGYQFTQTNYVNLNLGWYSDDVCYDM